jgi:hypothetical protein
MHCHIIVATASVSALHSGRGKQHTCGWVAGSCELKVHACSVPVIFTCRLPARLAATDLNFNFTRVQVFPAVF